MRALELPKLLRVQISPSFYRLRSTTIPKRDAHIFEHSTTVDEETITFYSNLASKWWDEQGEMKALHSLNKLRVQFIRDGLINTGQIDPKNYNMSQPLQGLKILDVGCGGGLLCEPLARIGATVTGIDASQNLIETAKAHVSKDPAICDKITYIYQTVEEHVNEHKNYYDAVIASEVVEHINQKELFMTSFSSSVKPGGSIFITTLNRTFALWLCGIVIAEYVLRIVPPGTHNINECITPHELQALLEKNGCSTKLIHGIRYNLFTNEWSWSSNPALNYALQAVRRREEC